MRKAKYNRLRLEIHSQDSAEVHWTHIVFGATDHLLHNDSIGPLRRVKRVPECIDFSVWTQV